MTKRDSLVGRLRNKILVGTLVASQVLGSYGCERNSEKPASLYQETDPSKLVLNMPLEGVAHIEQYSVPDSKYNLTMVRQIHAQSTGAFSPVERSRRYGLEQNLLQTLNSIEAQRATKAFYPEGVRVENENELNQILLGEKEKVKNPSLYSIDLLRYLGDPTLQVAEAASVYSIQHNLPLHATMNKALADKANQETKKDPSTWNKQIVYEDKEDFTLQRIAQEYPAGNNAITTIWGLNHDFRNNIESWNQKHPQAKFSLIIVTPANVAEADARK